MKLEISDWNMIPYAGAWSRQTEWFDALVHAKQAGECYVNHIVLCEHPHVYTLGRSGKEGNMLLGEEQLRRIGATLYHIDRGGDITYHGPGQLVCYPILNLDDFSLGLKEYVHLLRLASLPDAWRRQRAFAWRAILPVPVRFVPSACAAAILSPCMDWH